MSEANYHEFTELPAWTRARWSDDRKHVLNESDPYKWSGKSEPPAIGEKVKIYMNRFGTGTVTGYFVEHNWFGILVRLDAPPEWWVKQTKARGQDPKTTNGHFFGADLEKWEERK